MLCPSLGIIPDTYVPASVSDRILCPCLGVRPDTMSHYRCQAKNVLSRCQAESALPQFQAEVTSLRPGFRPRVPYPDASGRGRLESFLNIMSRQCQAESALLKCSAESALSKRRAESALSKCRVLHLSVRLREPPQPGRGRRGSVSLSPSLSGRGRARSPPSRSAVLAAGPTGLNRPPGADLPSQ